MPAPRKETSETISAHLSSAAAEGQQLLCSLALQHRAASARDSREPQQRRRFSPGALVYLPPLEAVFPKLFIDRALACQVAKGTSFGYPKSELNMHTRKPRFNLGLFEVRAHVVTNRAQSGELCSDKAPSSQAGCAARARAAALQPERWQADEGGWSWGKRVRSGLEGLPGGCWVRCSAQAGGQLLLGNQHRPPPKRCSPHHPLAPHAVGWD